MPNGEPNGPPKLVTPELIELSRWLSDWIKALRDVDKRHDDQIGHTQSRIVQAEESLHRVDRLLDSVEEWERKAQTYERTWDELVEEVKLRQATVGQSVNFLEQKIETHVGQFVTALAVVKADLDKSIASLKESIERVDSIRVENVKGKWTIRERIVSGILNNLPAIITSITALVVAIAALNK